MQRGGCGKGLCRGNRWWGLLKRTHTNLSFRTALPPLLPCISSLWPPRPSLLSSPLLSSPLLSRSAAAACVYSAREREGPARGQCRLSERLSTPRLSEEVCMGADQHPLHKLHSHPPLSFTHTFAYQAGMHTQTTPRSFLLCVFASRFPQAPSRQPLPFGGCSRDPVAPVQDPHTVSHFPVSNVSPPRNDHEGGPRWNPAVGTWYTGSCTGRLRREHISAVQTASGVFDIIDILWPAVFLRSPRAIQAHCF